MFKLLLILEQKDVSKCFILYYIILRIILRNEKKIYQTTYISQRKYKKKRKIECSQFFQRLTLQDQKRSPRASEMAVFLWQGYSHDLCLSLKMS